VTRHGLTLVETLVGLALLGLVSALGLSTLGLVGRAGGVAAADATAVALAQDLLRLRLRSAVPVLTEGPGGRPALLFEGGPERVAFVSELPPRFGAAGLAIVELRHDAGTLALRWRPLRGAVGDEGAAGRALLEGVAAVRLRYFGAPRGRDEPAWRETWTEAAALPAAVAVDVDFAEGDVRRWPGLVVAPRLAVASGAAAP
jgi:general secretion pathway protein J